MRMTVICVCANVVRPEDKTERFAYWRTIFAEQSVILFQVMRQKKFGEMFLVLEFPSYNLGMMENSPLNSLMIKLLQRVTPQFPELQAQMDAYREAKAKTDDRDEKGKLTQAARNAREMLRNGLLLQMPVRRARRQYEKAVRKRKAKAEKLVAEALLAVFEHDQFQTELDILDEFDPGHEGDVPPSRESHDLKTLDAMVRPFIEALIERGISPSTIGRLGALQLDLIAQFIVDLRDDPDIDRPDNLWGRMAKAGILEAYVGGMTSEEAAVIEYARSRDRFDEKALKFAERAREACGLSPGFSTDFLLGAYYLRSARGDISEGTARAYARAHTLSRTRDIELLGKVLGLTAEADLESLQTLVAYLRERNKYEFSDLPITVQVLAVRREFNRLEAHHRSTDDWARDAVKMILSLVNDFEDTVPGSEAFEFLLQSGFRLSDTYEEITRRHEIRARKRSREAFLDRIRFACNLGHRFKIDGESVLLECDAGFDEIDATVWDQESWEAEHGRLFDDENYEIDEDEIAADGAPADENESAIEVDDVVIDGSDSLDENDAGESLKDESDELSAEPTQARNLPAIIEPQREDAPSLFDFEARAAENLTQSDSDAEAASSGSVPASRPRPIPRKSIDQLTDEDFR